MGRYKCSADKCESSSETDIKFFKFPLYNPKKLKRWLLSMNREDWTPSRFSVLCMNHFEEQHIDRTGKTITLKEDAVPTIFTHTDSTQTVNQPSNEDTVATPKSKSGRPRGRPPKPKEPVLASTVVSEIVTVNAETEEVVQEEQPITERESEVPEKWSIIVDEDLLKINSLPHFFHGSYCASQDIQWAPDEHSSTEANAVSYLIEVTGKWQWLGLDVRGPLPETKAGHKYILSVTDYFSKWIEAWPIDSILPENLVEHIVEVINHFGYPLRILSRLPLDTVNKMNEQLQTQLKVEFPLVAHHQKTGSVDLTTQQMIDRMVDDLLEEHVSDWDIFLPAKVFSLCFKEHSLTQERPFTVLCCKGPELCHSPKSLEMQDIDLKDCDFLVH